MLLNPTLAQRVREIVLTRTPRPTNQVQAEILLRRLPRNRAEARRFIATKGGLVRV